MHPSTVYIVIAVLTFGIFSGINLHEFVDYGDKQMILGNELVKGGLDAEHAARAFAVEPGVAWQPLAWLSLQAQRDYFGLIVPAPYMLANLVLHILASLVLLFALSRLTLRFWPSAFVAAVYAVHPISVETLAWASARSDALANVFFAALLACWALYVERPSRARYAGVVVCAVLGVLSGGRFAAVPFVLLVLDVWPLGRLGFAGVRVGRFADRPEASATRLLVEKAPLLVIGVVGLWARLFADSAVANTWGSDPGLLGRAGLVLVNVFDAAGRILWPSGLAFTVPNHVQMGLGPVPVWQAGLALVALAAITWGLARLGASGRPMLVGWLWFLVLTVPVAGFVPMGLRMMNDRHLQLSLVGLAVVVAFGAAWALERVPRREIVAAVLAALVLVPLAWAARVQTDTWRDSDALFDQALAVNDRDAMALYYKAMRLARGGFETAAIAQLERALEVYPNHIHANLVVGQMHLQAGEPRLALVPLRRAQLGMPGSVLPRVYIAVALMDMGETSEAMFTIDEAISLEPGSALAHVQRARMHAGQGRSDEALADYRKALELDPSDGVARAELGRLERALERAAES